MKCFKLLLATALLMVGLPGITMATNIEVTAEYDLKDAINYVNQANIDTMFLATSGGVYTTTDSFALSLLKPVVIMPLPGLAERPIITNSDMNQDQLDILRVYDDLTVEGVIFDGGHEQSHGMKYALRMDNDETRGYTVDTDADLHVKDCIFRDFFQDKDPQSEGHVFKVAKVKVGTIIFEDCYMENTGYEAIRISDTEKWDTDKACDTLIVRNCTFENIAAECVRFYADKDTSTEDAYVLLEHLTINNCGTEAIYIKNNQFALARDIIITNSRPSYRIDRNDFLIELQQRGSWISNIDTFNCSSLTGLRRFEETEIYVSKYNGRSVDKATVWGFDPLYADAANFDYTLAANSHAFYSGHDGSALGDLKWAAATPTVIPFTYTIEGKGMLQFDPELQGRCYDDGENVTITAVPDSGYEFSGWGGDLSGSDNPASLTVDAAKSISATFTPATSIDEETTVPFNFTLEQNYPNPFNPVTTINYTLEKPDNVSLRIYDLSGSLVATLVNKKQDAGQHAIQWFASDLASGVYFYRLQSGSHTAIKKMMLMK